MMEQQCSTTNFPTTTCSSGKPNSKTQQTDEWEETTCNSATIQLQFSCDMWLDNPRREIQTEQNELLSTSGHWTCLGNQRRPASAIPSASQTKPTTEAHKSCRQHPCQGMFQSHPFRSLQRLSKLTTTIESNKNLPLDKIYPHAMPRTGHTQSILR